MSDRYTEQMRLELAQQIAAQIADSRADWVRAKSAVLERAQSTLGRSAAGAMPSNAQIESAVRAHFALFDPEEHKRVLQRKRTLALELLEALDPFEVFLAGAVLNGAAHEDSVIVLEAFCDDPKALEAALMDAGLAFEAVDAPQSNMPDPMESLGLLVPVRGGCEAVRIDVYETRDRSRNPSRSTPDANQTDAEAAGRVDRRTLAELLRR